MEHEVFVAEFIPHGGHGCTGCRQVLFFWPLHSGEHETHRAGKLLAQAHTAIDGEAKFVTRTPGSGGRILNCWVLPLTVGTEH